MAGRKKREGPVNYFELPRKQLQSMCKKYGYPANRTNLLMAEFLTSHLNSDEYLYRDMSQPSPAVKTRFQCREEEPTTDNILSTISESQPENFGTDGRRLSHEFMDTDAAQSDCPLEASKSADTGGLGGTIEEPTADNTLLTPSESQPPKVQTEERRISHEFMDTDTAHTDDCLHEASKSADTGLAQNNEEPTADNTLSNRAESEPANVETDGRMLSREFMDTEAAHTDCQLEASESAGTDLGQKDQIKSVDIEIGIAETGTELDLVGTPDTTEYVSTQSPRAIEDLSKSEEKAAEQPSVAVSFLDIDFTGMKVQCAARGPAPRVELETDFTEVREQITADKPTPLSPLDSNRLATEQVVDSSPNPTTPTKSLGILDILSEVEGKENGNGLSLFGKENEWSRRQELHKTPLTGRSKEKALRAAEKQACNLREQLLKKRRGMMMKEQDEHIVD